MRRLTLVLTLVLGACASAGDPGSGPPDAQAPPDACVPATETCNNLDDDCDNNIDEDIAMLGTACMVGEGTCTATGMYVCDDAGGVVCDATSGTPAGELCNGLDDDCDQGIDEGLMVGDPCDGTDPDACNEGHIVCMTNSAVCDDATGDTPELCNGLDDDCRNGIDDPWPVNQACTVGVGACSASGVWQCNTTSSVACSATAGSPTPEFCGDGVDQDCNGGDVTCPTNDLASGAIDISGGGTFSADLTAAHDDHTVGTCGYPSGGGRDLYYYFYLPADEVVYADTFGSSFDSVLRLYSGFCTSIASEMACADDSCTSFGPSQIATQLAGGSYYCLIVDQFSSTSTTGAVTLNFVRGGRTGTRISSATSGTLTGTTTGGANAQPSTACISSSGPEANYYWTRCPADAARSVDAATCSGTAWDTIITLRTGAAETACADDQCGAAPARQSILPTTVVNGPGLFWLVLDGWSGANGAYSMTYSN